jgi:hypothetical protein
VLQSAAPVLPRELPTAAPPPPLRRSLLFLEAPRADLWACVHPGGAGEDDEWESPGTQGAAWLGHLRRGWGRVDPPHSVVGRAPSPATTAPTRRRRRRIFSRNADSQALLGAPILLSARSPPHPLDLSGSAVRIRKEQTRKERGSENFTTKDLSYFYTAYNFFTIR